MSREDDWRRFADAEIDLDGVTAFIDVTISMDGVPCVDLSLTERQVTLDADKAQQIGMQLIAAALVCRRRQKEGG